MPFYTGLSQFYTGDTQGVDTRHRLRKSGKTDNERNGLACDLPVEVMKHITKKGIKPMTSVDEINILLHAIKWNIIPSINSFKFYSILSFCIALKIYYIKIAVYIPEIY